MTDYPGPYLASDYPGFREYGGVEECGGRWWGFVAVDNVPEGRRDLIARLLGEYGGELRGVELQLQTSGADYKLRWSRRGSGSKITEAEVSLIQGEVAGGLDYVRWGGGPG